MVRKFEGKYDAKSFFAAGVPLTPFCEQLYGSPGFPLATNVPRASRAAELYAGSVGLPKIGSAMNARTVQRISRKAMN